MSNFRTFQYQWNPGTEFSDNSSVFPRGVFQIRRFPEVFQICGQPAVAPVNQAADMIMTRRSDIQSMVGASRLVSHHMSSGCAMAITRSVYKRRLLPRLNDSESVSDIRITCIDRTYVHNQQYTVFQNN